MKKFFIIACLVAVVGCTTETKPSAAKKDEPKVNEPAKGAKPAME
jgi:hypothetical protein